MAGCILSKILSELPVYLLQPLISSLGSFQETFPCVASIQRS